MFSPTPDEIIDIQQRSADGYAIVTILTHYGYDPYGPEYDTVYNVIHGRRLFRGTPPAQRWTPDCITRAEYDEWKALMRSMTRREHWVSRPCDDCDIRWATQQRADGRCNGTLQGERADAVRAAEPAALSAVSGQWRPQTIGQGDHP